MSAMSSTLPCAQNMIANASHVSTSSTTPNLSSRRSCATAPTASWGMSTRVPRAGDDAGIARRPARRGHLFANRLYAVSCSDQGPRQNELGPATAGRGVGCARARRQGKPHRYGLGCSGAGVGSRLRTSWGRLCVAAAATAGSMPLGWPFVSGAHTRLLPFSAGIPKQCARPAFVPLVDGGAGEQRQVG